MFGYITGCIKNKNNHLEPAIIGIIWLHWMSMVINFAHLLYSVVAYVILHMNEMLLCYIVHIQYCYISEVQTLQIILLVL